MKLILTLLLLTIVAINGIANPQFKPQLDIGFNITGGGTLLLDKSEKDRPSGNFTNKAGENFSIFLNYSSGFTVGGVNATIWAITPEEQVNEFTASRIGLKLELNYASHIGIFDEQIFGTSLENRDFLPGSFILHDINMVLAVVTTYNYGAFISLGGSIGLQNLRFSAVTINDETFNLKDSTQFAIAFVFDCGWFIPFQNGNNLKIGIRTRIGPANNYILVGPLVGGYINYNFNLTRSNA
jgi:hypothetical protein